MRLTKFDQDCTIFEHQPVIEFFDF